MTEVKTHCLNCNAPLERAIAISGATSQFWLSCTRCNALYNTYQPQPHQLATHEDQHLYVMNAGGYGSGKTLTSQQEIYRHLFYTPNANILIGANIRPQYEQTIQRDIENDLPRQLVAYENKTKSYVDFINGARILYRPLSEPEKLRSLNLTMFVIVEGSEVPADAYHQLKTRLRNQAAFTEEHDWRRGIIETNPSSGWVRNDVLLNAEEVHTHGNTSERYPPALKPDPNISAHITATNANKYLPPNFIQELAANKPDWWIRRFLYGSFQYAEGLVYPRMAAVVVEPFEIPKSWKRLVACDYGLADKFTFTAGAIDPTRNKLVVYKNWATNDKNIEALSKMYYKFTEDIPAGGLLAPPILDPKSGAKRDYNKKTLYDHFLDYGIAFQPGHIQVDARVYRVNTYLETDRMEIFSTCEELLEEGSKYKFPDKTLTSVASAKADKPIDKDNHSINGLEWICMALPADPAKLNNAVYRVPTLGETKNSNQYGWQLSDNDVQSDDFYSVYQLY